jgi:hypothetical protein
MNNNTHGLLRRLGQRCTNPGNQVIRPTKFLAVESKICRSSSMEFAPSHPAGALNFEVASEVWKVCAPSALSHNSWRKSLLEKLTVAQLVKKFPPVYDTRSFITVFTKSNT